MSRYLVAALGLLLSLTASPAWAQKSETEIPGVTAELLELRVHDGVSRLAIRLVNGGAVATTAAPALYWSKVVLIDAKANVKYTVMQDDDGNYLSGPIGDRNSGGRWTINIPARGQVVLWAWFEPLPVGTVVSVHVPAMFPFDGVKVVEGPGTLLSPTTTATEIAAVTATLISARRVDQHLALRLRLVAGTTGIADAPNVLYKDVFFVDPRSRQKFPVLRDPTGAFQAEPVSDGNSGGRLWLSFMSPKAVALMSLTLQAPPDAVMTGDLLIPGFLPIEGLTIAGGAATPGATTPGAAAARPAPVAAQPIAGFDPANGFKALQKESDTLRQQVATLQANGNAAAKAAGAAVGVNSARSKVLSGDPCCASPVQQLRATIDRARSGAAQLQDHFRTSKQPQWVTGFGEVQTALSQFATTLDAFVAAPNVAAGVAALAALSPAMDAVRSKVAGLAPCCEGK